MGSCFACFFPKKKLEVDYSVYFDADSPMCEPLLSKSDFLMRDSVIEAQLYDSDEITGELSFSQDDGWGGNRSCFGD